MKQGWKIKKLGEVTTSINGLWTGKKPPFITIAVIRNTNFTKDCKLDTSDIAYIDVELKQYARRKLQCGDIIIEKSGGSDKQPVGRPILFNIEEGEYSFSNFTSTLRVNDKTATIPEFIHRYLAHIYMRGDTAAMQSKTTGIRNLDFNLYKSINIPIPPLPEQEKIVAELDCLSGVIEKKKQQLKELDALAESIFYTMFGDPITNEKGWDVKRLGEVCYKIGDGLHGTPKYDEDGEVAFINGNNLIDGRIVITDRTLFVNDIEAQKYKIGLNTNTILLSINGTLGRTAIYRNENIILGKSACYCDLNNAFLITKFVEHLMNSLSFKGFLEDNSSKSTIKNVGLKAIRNYEIILPPLTLQQEFATKIEAIEKQKELIKESIIQTEELFNSRMDYYFG